MKAQYLTNLVQRSAFIPPMGQKQEVVVSYPNTIDVHDLAIHLRSRQLNYNLRVHHFTGDSFILDYGKLAQTLDGCSKTTTYQIDDFGAHKSSRAPRWLDCILGFDASVNVMVCRDCTASLRARVLMNDTKDRSIKWNNMPSRNYYSYVPLDGSPPRFLDVEVEEDQVEILHAMRLTRIILRALEVSAFRALQREVNDLPSKKGSDTELVMLARRLAGFLFNMRWRISWWAILDIKLDHSDDSNNDYTERVTELTKTLYFWYFVVKTKLPRSEVTAIETVDNYCPNTNDPSLGDYPEDESIGGFHSWMAHGYQLVLEAAGQQLLPWPALHL